MRDSLYVRMLVRSVLVRPARFLTAALALAAGTAIVALALNLSFRVRQHFARELAAYGANAYVVPRAAAQEVGAGGISFGTGAGGGGGIGAETLARLSPVLDAAGAWRSLALVPVTVGETPLLLCLVDMARLPEFRPWWTRSPEQQLWNPGVSGLRLGASPALAGRIDLPRGELRKLSAAGIGGDAGLT
ncbi:MAG: hypothetical protein HZA54_06875, partial [Planctomycetes bacterium]|nr:hypothetical protein [Planctomycetota bacterium]